MTRRVVGLLIVLVLAWGGLALAIANGLTPLLGLDLQGGTAVVLTAPVGTPTEVLEDAIAVMNLRIEGIGAVQEPEIAISGENTVVVQLPGVEDEARAIEAVGSTGLLSFRPVLVSVPGSIGPLAGTNTPGIDNESGLTIDDDIHGEAWLLDQAVAFDSVVILVGPAQLEGSHVAGANTLPPNPNDPGWAVSLDLTGEGGVLFAQMTADAAGFPGNDPRRQIAIVLDGEIITAPSVNQGVSPATGITGGTALITVGAGEEGQKEANDLAVVLRYGSLPIAFEVSAVNKVSGTLGEDSLQAGILAGAIGLALVAIVLLIVYRSLGLVAIVGLTVFGSLLITVFALAGEWFGLTLTLAGITGIIVAIGITADSYIVYFERVKEKVRQGYPVEEATEEGFRLAYRTILTADTVSFLAALLLLMLAVGAVKGFALSLLIATILDVLIAPVYTRTTALILSDTRLGAGGAFSIEGASR